MKRFLSSILFTVLLCPVLFLSCVRKAADPAQKLSSEISNGAPVIGFSIDTLAIERWQRDLDLFMNEARRLGAEVIVQNAGNSIEEQNRQILYLASRNVDVIVIIAKEARSFSETIDKVHSKNIPVLSYDRLILDADIDLYMTVDSEKVGKIMGKTMMARTSQKNWALVLGPKEDNNMDMIRSGILSSIKNSGVVITNEFYTSGWNYDLSRQYAIDMVTSGKIPDVIICGNDAVADSVIGVINQYYTGDHVFICGQDADIAACQNIVKGYQDFTVYKPIGELAKQAAGCAVRLAKGESPEEIAKDGTFIHNGFGSIPSILLEPQCVDQTNLREVIVDSGFHTEGEIFR